MCSDIVVGHRVVHISTTCMQNERIYIERQILKVIKKIESIQAQSTQIPENNTQPIIAVRTNY